MCRKSFPSPLGQCRSDAARDPVRGTDQLLAREQGDTGSNGTGGIEPFQDHVDGRRGVVGFNGDQIQELHPPVRGVDGELVQEPSVTSPSRGAFGRSPKFPPVSGQGCPHLPARDRALQQPTQLLRARVAFGYDGGLRAFVPGHAYSGLCTGQVQGRQEKVGVGPLKRRTRHHERYPPLHMRPTKRRTQRFCVVRHRTSQGASGYASTSPARPDDQMFRASRTQSGQRSPLVCSQ